MLRTLALRLALLSCLSLYAIHFIILQGYAVNIPYWDEWDALNPNQLPAGFSLRWLFSQHNEHRIVTTRLFTWVLYRLNGWNLVTHQTINFLLYGVLLVVVILFARKFVPQVKAWVVLSFTPFMLSPINWENHFWGFQMQFHFSLLFLIATIYFWYEEEQRWSGMFLGSAMAILSIYSMSSGLISSFVCLFIFGLFKLLRARSASPPQDRKRELQQLLVVVGLVGMAMALWFVDYRAVATHPSLALPYTPLFWSYFANIIGLGFGLDGLAFLPNLFCLAIVLAPIAWMVWQRKGRLPNSSWAVYAAVACIVAALSVITMGRANFGPEQAKASRYSEIGMMLIPLTVLAYSIALQNRDRLRALFLMAFWVFCFFTFENNWREFSQYEVAAKQRTRGILCIEKYYARKEDAVCPSLYPEPIGRKLDEAQKLNLSFYRNMQQYVVLSQEPATRSGVELKTLYYIDLLNGQLLSKGATVVINRQMTREISLTGWAVDANSESEAADVYIVVDGQTEIPATYGLARPDVAEVHKNPRYRFSGFSGSIPTASLVPGRHTLSLKIQKTFRNGYYEPEEKIEIDVR